jgi:predicted dehydrogenase
VEGINRMSERFRGALVGCGFFARNHMHGWQGVDGAEIVAVCDLDAEKARRMAEDFGVPRHYTDMAAMLAAERLDFVDVATTAPSHRPLVCLALDNGIAAICQKPFAETYEDAEAMVRAAERAGRPLLVHENFRWERPFLELAKRLRAGEIGRPFFGHLSFRHGYDNYRNQPYLAEIDRFAIMDVGLHLFDLARWLLGDVASIHCRTQRYNPRVKGEDAFTASLRHENGAVCVVDCSFFTKLEPEPFPQTAARIEGENGTLELTRDYRLLVHHAGRLEVIDVDPPVPAWGARPWHCVQDSVVAIERHWIDVLAGRAEPQPSGADNLKTLRLAFAAYESAERDAAVTIDGSRP